MIIPFQTITQSLELYKSLHAPAPTFGMDIYSMNFIPKGIVLLSNNGEGNKGIPIRCDHFIIVLCVDGQSHRRINYHRFQITKHSAHIILPGQIHSFSNTTSDFEIYILLFERSYLSQFNIPSPILDNLLNLDGDSNPNMKLDSQEFSAWLSIFKQLDHELHSKKRYHHEIVITHIINLLLRIKRRSYNQSIPPHKSGRQNELFAGFKSLIEQHFQHKKTVMEYADLMNVTAKHLSETVKSLTNYTALFYIHERIVHEAEYLLVYSDLSVKEISHVLNFENPSHFGRFFKKHKGITPLKFRSLNK